MAPPRPLWLILTLATATAAVFMVIILGFARMLPAAHADHRSLHAGAVPRIGGAAIFAGWFSCTPWISLPAFWYGPLLLLLAVSLWDDFRALPAWLRLTMHLVACGGWIVATDCGLGLGASVLLSIVLAWTINLYNFMDGSDGLAASMTVTGFSAYAAAAASREVGSQSELFGGAVTLVVATIPFLVANLPRAKVFLGDTGAIPLGFLAGAFGFMGWCEKLWPWWFPPLVFLPFIADATVTLGKRFWRRERFWEPHRQHYYQRLVLLGCGHRGTLAVYATFMAGTATTAWVVLRAKPSWGAPALIAWSLVLGALFMTIDRRWHHFLSQSHDRPR